MSYRKNRGKRPNQQIRNNPKTGRPEQFKGKQSTASKSGSNNAQQGKATFAFSPVAEGKKIRVKPCTCIGEQVSKKNEQMHFEMRQICSKKLKWDDVEGGFKPAYVLPRSFLKKHASHMKHFHRYLRENNIPLY